MKKLIEEKALIPEKVEIKLDKDVVAVRGPKGEVSRKCFYPGVSVEVRGNEVSVKAEKSTKKEKRMIGTFISHIKNMVRGVTEGYEYKLKICATHFPMSFSVKNDECIVQNFLGEKVPRTAKLSKGVSIKIEGQEITVESPDKEAAGQAAGAIEQLCRIADKDRRVFQDGIYITKKPSR